MSWLIRSGPGVLPLILAEQAFSSSDVARLGQFQLYGLYRFQVGSGALGGIGNKVSLKTLYLSQKSVLFKIGRIFSTSRFFVYARALKIDFGSSFSKN